MSMHVSMFSIAMKDYSKLLFKSGFAGCRRLGTKVRVVHSNTLYIKIKCFNCGFHVPIILTNVSVSAYSAFCDSVIDCKEPE